MAITPPEERIWWNTPIHRTELIWIVIALVWGLVFWGYLPGGDTLLGLGLIVGAGLYIVRRETVRGRRIVTSRPLR